MLALCHHTLKWSHILLWMERWRAFSPALHVGAARDSSFRGMVRAWPTRDSWTSTCFFGQLLAPWLFDLDVSFNGKACRALLALCCAGRAQDPVGGRRRRAAFDAAKGMQPPAKPLGCVPGSAGFTHAKCFGSRPFSLNPNRSSKHAIDAARRNSYLVCWQACDSKLSICFD